MLVDEFANDLIVADYFAMLADDMAGLPYNKAHAQDLAQVVADIGASGAISLRATAAELNARRMMTRQGGTWQVSNERNLLRRSGSKP